MPCFHLDSFDETTFTDDENWFNWTEYKNKKATNITEISCAELTKVDTGLYQSTYPIREVGKPMTILEFVKTRPLDEICLYSKRLVREIIQSGDISRYINSCGVQLQYHILYKYGSLFSTPITVYPAIQSKVVNKLGYHNISNPEPYLYKHITNVNKISINNLPLEIQLHVIKQYPKLIRSIKHFNVDLQIGIARLGYIHDLKNPCDMAYEAALEVYMCDCHWCLLRYGSLKNKDLYHKKQLELVKSNFQKFRIEYCVDVWEWMLKNHRRHVAYAVLIYQRWSPSDPDIVPEVIDILVNRYPYIIAKAFVNLTYQNEYFRNYQLLNFALNHQYLFIKCLSRFDINRCEREIVKLIKVLPINVVDKIGNNSTCKINLAVAKRRGSIFFQFYWELMDLIYS